MEPIRRPASLRRPRINYALSDVDDDDATDSNSVKDAGKKDDELKGDPTYDVNQRTKPRTKRVKRAPLTTPATTPEPPAEDRDFRFFPKLPAELQLMVWKESICSRELTSPHRPHVKGVQYFSIFDTSRPSSHRHQAVMHVPNNGLRLESRFELGPPRVRNLSPNDAVQYSWFDGNRSLYALDTGLYSACQDSREVIKRAAAAAKTHPNTDVERAHSLSQQRQCKVHHSATTNLTLDVRHNDLIVLEFAQADLETSKSLNWADIWSHSMFHWPRLKTDFAFEFDESWLEGLAPTADEPFTLHAEASPRGVFARCYDAWCRQELSGRFINPIILIDRDAKMSKYLACRVEHFARHRHYGFAAHDIWEDQRDTFALIDPCYPAVRELSRQREQGALGFVKWMRARQRKWRRQGPVVQVVVRLPRDRYKPPFKFKYDSSGSSIIGVLNE